MIHKYEPNQHLVSRNELSVDGLMWFLMSEDNLVMSPESLLKSDNMEFPLSHYYIKSSHNTYLTGHQITGKASVEIYRQVRRCEDAPISSNIPGPSIRLSLHRA